MGRKLISFDWAIKKILRSKANFVVLAGFLSELLFEDITILEILESESNQESCEDKSNRVDIKVKNSKQEIILIEIQYSRELDYMHRILYASSKAITEHIQAGSSYASISKVISISILHFDFGSGDDYIYKGRTTFKGLHTHQTLHLDTAQQNLYKTKHIEEIYPEYYLIKVKNFNDVSKDSLDDWIHFLKNEQIPKNTKAKGLQEAKEILDYLKMSEAEQRDYNQAQEQIRREASAYESTYVSGKIEGIELNKRETVIAAHRCGIENSKIANITNLELVEVENILSNEQ